jgi:N-acetylglucosamine-6-phosphate deacetylase
MISHHVDSSPIWLIQKGVSSSQTVRLVSPVDKLARLAIFRVAMKALDPHLPDGVHEWRDGQRFVKEGDKLYLQGTNTLAGR